MKRTEGTLNNAACTNAANAANAANVAASKYSALTRVPTGSPIAVTVATCGRCRDAPVTAAGPHPRLRLSKICALVADSTFTNQAAATARPVLGVGVLGP